MNKYIVYFVLSISQYIMDRSTSSCMTNSGEFLLLFHHFFAIYLVATTRTLNVVCNSYPINQIGHIINQVKNLSSKLTAKLSLPIFLQSLL